MSRLGHIYNCQAAVSQRNTMIFIYPDAIAVWSAITDRIGHTMNTGLQINWTMTFHESYAGDTTH